MWPFIYLEMKKKEGELRKWLTATLQITGTLPYSETVGVGNNSKTITKNTREAMLDFLRSDEALVVFSNSQEVIAVANIFNIKINIFTYSHDKQGWSEVHPDPIMVATTEVTFGQWDPDMFLYYSMDTHYDLLVKDDSKFVCNIPITGKCF